MQQHFKFKRHQCPECGERFSQKKNLFGRGGHCSARMCRHCNTSMTCLTQHRLVCTSAAAASPPSSPRARSSPGDVSTGDENSNDDGDAMDENVDDSVSSRSGSTVSSNASRHTSLQPDDTSGDRGSRNSSSP